MSKSFKSVNKQQVNRPCKSEFGSHSDMILREINETHVLCKDQFGEYQTEKFRIDNDLMDPNRCRGSRIKIER